MTIPTFTKHRRVIDGWVALIDYRTADGQWRLVRDGSYVEGVLWRLERFDGVQPYPWHIVAATEESSGLVCPYEWRYLDDAKREAPAIVAELLN